MKQLLKSAIYNEQNISMNKETTLKLMRVYNLFLMNIGHDTLAYNDEPWNHYQIYWVDLKRTHDISKGFTSGYDLLWAMAYDNQFIDYLDNNPNTSMEVITLIKV